ncbi:hypothetical protein X975_04633, partial [Stegodyphus mimosarum]
MICRKSGLKFEVFTRRWIKSPTSAPTTRIFATASSYQGPSPSDHSTMNTLHAILFNSTSFNFCKAKHLLHTNYH